MPVCRQAGTNVHTCVPKHFGAQACLPTRQAQQGYEKNMLACRKALQYAGLSALSADSLPAAGRAGEQAGMRVPWYQKVSV
jgi:hypothetical protein